MYYQFEDLNIDADRRSVTRNGEVLDVPALSYRVLLALAEAAPKLLTQDELVDKAWGEGRVVTPENLSQRIMLLRQALGDSAQEPRYIEGVRGQGFRLIPEVKKVSGAAGTETISRFPRPLITVLLMLVGAAGLWWLLSLTHVPDEENISQQALPAAADGSSASGIAPAVAVLPFINMSSDPKQTYFGEGMAEEIINTLVQQTRIPVVARTSSFSEELRGLDGREIGQALAASHLLEGSVRSVGDQVRVTAQLIDAPSGYHLWSEQYDRAQDDILNIQTEIASSIVQAMSQHIDAQGDIRLAGMFSEGSAPERRPVNPAAYEAYLQGLGFAHRATPEDTAEALKYLQRATELDPRYLDAWKALIRTQLYVTQFPLFVDDFADVYDRVEGWLDTVRPMYPDDAYLKLVSGAMLAFNHYRWSEGVQIIDESLPALQNDAHALTLVGVLFAHLHFPEALDIMEQAHALDPWSPHVLYGLSWAYFLNDRQDDAMRLLDHDRHPYFTAANRAQLNYMTYDQDQMVHNHRIMGQTLAPEHPIMRSVESMILDIQGELEASYVIGDELIANMEQQPVYMGWFSMQRARAFNELFHVFNQQRQMTLIYWLINANKAGSLQPQVQAQNLKDVPSDRVRQIFFLSEERRAELLALEQPHSEEKLQRFVGHYGAGFQGIHFSLVDGRLAYQSRYYGGSAVAIGENRFVSLLESDMEFEFFTNDAGEVDLCVWRRGQKRYIAYRQEDIALTPRSEGVGRR